MNELAGYSLGGYQLEEEIGRGSMGVVYRGKQIALSRDVAIKILPQSLAKDASYVARFIREAQIIAGLNHPNIVQIYDAGQQNRILYFVMEFIQGPTLASLLLMDGIIPQHLAAEYGAQIADALDAAYRERFVVHRDIKPENLMLNRWGKIKVMDFGLARATGLQTITVAKSLVGSIYYSSPEQIWGQTLDNRSDIFALGVVLFEMVSGRRPFNGRSMTELSQAIINGNLQPPSTYNPDLSADLERIIMKALARNRDERYEDAAMLAQELRMLQLQAPKTPIVSIPPSLSLSGVLPNEQLLPDNMPLVTPDDAQQLQHTGENERLILPKRPQVPPLSYLVLTPNQEKSLPTTPTEPINGQSEYGFPTNDTTHPLTDQESIEDTDTVGELQQVSSSSRPQTTPKIISDDTPEARNAQEQERSTVKGQIHRLFRLPSRKVQITETHPDTETTSDT